MRTILRALNKFRNGKIGEDQVKREITEVFPTGNIWRAHDEYREYFNDLAAHLPIRKKKTDQLAETKLDSALMMYGRFPGAYEQKGKPKHQVLRL